MTAKQDILTSATKRVEELQGQIAFWESRLLSDDDEETMLKNQGKLEALQAELSQQERTVSNTKGELAKAKAAAEKA